jgi:hypothetical protein
MLVQTKDTRGILPQASFFFRALAGDLRFYIKKEEGYKQHRTTGYSREL